MKPIAFATYASLCVFLSGCVDVNQKKEEVAAQAQQQQDMAAADQGGEKKDEKGIIGKTTAEVVDAKKALAENPNLLVFERQGLGNNPLSQSANAYVYLRSEVSTLGMQQAIRAHQALEDRWPTYDEFMKIMRDSGVKFTMLYRWQKYGYDEDSGSIMILQDEEMKKKIYDEAWLDYENSEL